MRIVETYSHLNGEEYLLVHRPGIYDEIKKGNRRGPSSITHNENKP